MTQYIMMPRRGLRAVEQSSMDSLLPLSYARSTREPVIPEDRHLRRLGMRVLDSAYENGPKLVDLPEDAADEFGTTAAGIGVRLEPLVSYRLAVSLFLTLQPPPGAGSGSALRLQIVDSNNQAGVSGARVTAYTSFPLRQGCEAVTDAQGWASLFLGGLSVSLDRFYVSPPLAGYWGAFRANHRLADGDVVAIEPLNTSQPGVLSHFYGASPARASQQIVVGVIDAGVGPHVDLAGIDGRNTVTGEPRGDFDDNGLGHGTHVAGIIAGTGTGLEGVAPGATLRSYRVFGKNQGTTTNYSIMKALLYAMDDGCHILNLSLTGESRSDPTLDEAFREARHRGVLVVIAAGNEFRAPIGYPAAYVDATGLVVAAMGRESCFPQGACETSVDRGTDPDNFAAPFTNIGPEIAVTAPGVGVVSCVANGYGVMSGTSMSAAVVSGIAARLLTQDLNNPVPVLQRTADSQRTQDMIQLVLNSSSRLGLGAPGPRSPYEGRGLPR